jgi:hypothetical protein
VATRQSDVHLYELARIGAQTQINDLVQEARLLVGLFPHLRDSIDTDELPVNFILRRGRDRAEGRAGKRPRRATSSARRPRA